MVNSTLLRTNIALVTLLSLAPLRASEPAPQTTCPESTISITATKNKSLVYKNTVHAFSIDYPKNWTLDDSGKLGTLVIFFSDKTEPCAQGDSNANIYVLSEPAQGLSLQQYVATTKELSAKLLQNYSATEENLTIGDEPAAILSSSFTQSDLHLKSIQLITLKNGIVYIITGTASATAWDQYKDEFMNSLKTFKLQ